MSQEVVAQSHLDQNFILNTTEATRAPKMIDDAPTL
jgi:hypothetical protein